MPRTSRSQRHAMWRQRLERYAQSDLTVAQFCQRENVSAPSFYQWKRRLAATNETADAQPQRKDASGGFNEVLVNAQPTVLVNAQPTAQATLPGGITISLGNQSDTVALIVDRLLRHAMTETDRGGDRTEGVNPSC
ncbi:MAG: hypothetical protein AAF497_11400 [Planctomycetota bacterium]